MMISGRRGAGPAAAALALAVALSMTAGSCGGGGGGKKKKKPKGRITLVSPAAGSVTGGSRVAILTVDFLDDFEVFEPEVLFDGVPAAVDGVVNPSELWVITPPGAALGRVDVVVKSTDRSQTARCEDCFEYLPPPPACGVTGITPDQADVAGGDRVTITGINFEPSAEVYFGSDTTQWVESTGGIFLDANTLEVTVPAEPTGQPVTVDVRVDIPGASTCSFPGGVSYIFPTCLIATVTPNTGSSLGGDLVTILGTGFDPASVPSFGGVISPSYTVVSNVEISAVTPAVMNPGAVVVTVTGPTNTCELDPGFTYQLPMGLCAVTSVTPAGGGLAGGTMVTITGADFEIPPDPDPLVEFGRGGTWAPALSVTNGMDTVTLTARTPAWTVAEKVDVRVTNQVSGLSCTLVDAFEYLDPGVCLLESVTPSQGPTAGGYVATIRGAGLDPNPLQILFANVQADLSTLNVIDANTVEVEVPLRAMEGVVDVTYVNSGPSPCVLPNGFEYKNPPTSCTITGVVPDTGPRTGSTMVTITGTDFPSDVRVLFGGTMANPYFTNVIDANTIEVLTPGILQPRCVDVTVIGVSSSAMCTLASGFCYTAGCTIVDITPPSGSMAGGDLVTITGSDFDPAGQVRFGDNFAPWVDFKSSTEIDVLAPPSAVSGPVDVKVFGSAAVQCTLAGGYDYVAGAGGGCTVAAVVPMQGPPQGGNIVNIIGSGFEGSPRPPGVLFGFNPSPGVTFVDSTQLQVVVPSALYPGSVDVTVVNDSGSSCTDPLAYMYDPLPTCNTLCAISRVQPDGGPLRGGNPVQITGSGFCDGAGVWFGARRVGAMVISDTEIRVFAPMSASAGWVFLAVEQPNGALCYEPDAYEYR